MTSTPCPGRWCLENDVTPWVAAVRELLTDRDRYKRESAASREAAGRFVSGLDAGDLERLLTSLKASAPVAQAGQASIESLTPEKRALLLERLRKRGTVR